MPPFAKAASMIMSLEKKPDRPGKPMMARYPRPKVTKVTGMYFRRAPYLRMSTSSFIPCITEPAPRKRPALKKPCVTRCMIAKT